MRSSHRTVSKAMARTVRGKSEWSNAMKTRSSKTYHGQTYGEGGWGELATGPVENQKPGAETKKTLKLEGQAHLGPQ